MYLRKNYEWDHSKITIKDSQYTMIELRTPDKF